MFADLSLHPHSDERKSRHPTPPAEIERRQRVAGCGRKQTKRCECLRLEAGTAVTREQCAVLEGGRLRPRQCALELYTLQLPLPIQPQPGLVPIHGSETC